MSRPTALIEDGRLSYEDIAAAWTNGNRSYALDVLENYGAAATAMLFAYGRDCGLSHADLVTIAGRLVDRVIDRNERALRRQDA